MALPPGPPGTLSKPSFWREARQCDAYCVRARSVACAWRQRRFVVAAPTSQTLEDGKAAARYAGKHARHSGASHARSSRVVRYQKQRAAAQRRRRTRQGPAHAQPLRVGGGAAMQRAVAPAGRDRRAHPLCRRPASVRLGSSGGGRLDGLGRPATRGAPHPWSARVPPRARLARQRTRALRRLRPPPRARCG